MELINNKSNTELISNPKTDFEIITFSIPNRDSKAIYDKERNSIVNIASIFDRPSKIHQDILNKAKEKVWKIVKSIKQIQAKKKNKSIHRKYILDPENSIIRYCLDAIISVFIFIDVIISPFEYFVYNYDNLSIVRETLFDVVFLVEIIANFFTGYYDEYEDVLITDPKIIAINYLKKGLIFHLVYTIPFWLINEWCYSLRLIKLYRYLDVITEMKKVIDFLVSLCLKNFKLKKFLVDLVSLGINLLFIIHLFACCYIFIAKFYSPNWAEANNLDINNISEIYVSGIYMITETFSTVGYGDLTPRNNYEIGFMMVCEVINCGLFGYLIANILELFMSQVDTLSFKYQTKINLFNWMISYTKHMPLTKEQKKSVTQEYLWEDVSLFFDLHYKTRNNYSWILLFPFLQQIKPNDKRKLLEKAFEKTTQRFNKFFDGLNSNTKFEIILNFKTHIQKSDYTPIKEQEDIQRVYFIQKGVVYVTKRQKVVCQIKKGEVFGFLGILDSMSEYTYEFSHNSKYVHLYSITLRKLQKILSHDEEGFKVLLDKAKERKLAFNYLGQMNDEKEELDNKAFADQNLTFIQRILDFTDYDFVINPQAKTLITEVNGEDLGNNAILKETLNKLQQKEKECKDLKMRLELINNQLQYLHNHYLAQV